MTEEKQVMCSTIAHHLLVNAQHLSEQWLVTPGQLPSVYTLNMTLYVMENPFCPVRNSCPSCVPFQLLVHLLMWQSMGN